MTEPEVRKAKHHEAGRILVDEPALMDLCQKARLWAKRSNAEGGVP